MDYDDLTPARAYREGFRWAPVFAVLGVLAVVVVVPTLLVGWLVGGWFQTHGIQRQYGNTVNSQGYQQNLLTEMQQNLSNITGPGGLASTRQSLAPGSGEDQVVRSQELAQLGKFCSEGAQLNFGAVPGGTDLQTIYGQNCEAGTVVASPPLAPAS